MIIKEQKEKLRVSKINTIHTARTIMFAELSKIMDYSMEHGQYVDSLDQNVFSKKSADGIRQTGSFLKRLYSFDNHYNLFIAFKYFWSISDKEEKPLIAFLYAINHDDLLAESLQVINKVNPGEKAAIEYFEENIEKYHPNKYTEKTRKSLAQNIASSWKQAGYIEGKVKNIRVAQEITYLVACFAFFISYLKGARGEFIWNSTGVKSLLLPEQKLRDLALECAKRDLMLYQFAGSVTSISFNSLLNKLGIDGN